MTRLAAKLWSAQMVPVFAEAGFGNHRDIHMSLFSSSTHHLLLPPFQGHGPTVAVYLAVPPSRHVGWSSPNASSVLRMERRCRRIAGRTCPWENRVCVGARMTGEEVHRLVWVRAHW